MGCCVSRSTGPNSPYPGGAPNTSARPINPPNLSLPESAESVSQGASRSRRRGQRPLDQHIDKPLRRHQWSSKNRQWSTSELARERRDFFDTRVTGRAEIWQTLHAALEVLWESGSQASDANGADGLATAQSILAAAEISLPTGNLVNGAYDSLGNYYQLPDWVVSDPDNVIQDVEAEVDDDDDEADPKTDKADADSPDNISDIERKREERGKSVVDARDQMTLRARLSENGRDITITFSKTENIRTLARRIGDEAELSKSRKIRLAYMGKILKENTSLEAQGWQDGHVINALVFENR